MSYKYINDIFVLGYENIINMKVPVNLNQYHIEKVILEHKGKCILLSSSHPETHEKIAIKCIPISYVHENGQEAELMKLLNHQNIIKIIDSFYYPKQNTRFFSIVMPRALADLTHYLLSHGPFDERLICSMMKQAFKAVQYLHENQIWHRDIKLDNFLVMEETRNGPIIALSDFGCSIEYKNLTYEGEILGTLQYAAPELVELKGENLCMKKTGKCLYFR